MKNQSNQNNQSNQKTTPAKPGRAKGAKKDSPTTGKSLPAGTAGASDKAVPKPDEKTVQKKAGDTAAARKPPNTAEKVSAKAEKTAAATQAAKPPGGSEKPAATAAKSTESGKVEERKGAGGGRWLGGVALLLAITAGFGVYYLYLQGQQQGTALEKRLGELQSSVEDNQSAIAANQRQLAQLEALKQQVDTLRGEVEKAASVRQRIEAEQQAINTSMTELATSLGRTTLAWRLAEVEHLLIVANTRLTLEHDLPTALVALETADRKLRAIGDPAFVPVRQAIAEEITALKGVAEPDITGMALKLASLAEAVDGLPLQNSRPVPATAPGIAGDKKDGDRSLDWSAIPGAVWEDLRSLVVVRRLDKPIEPLLPPAEAWYLRQNLKLKLEQARLSLLRQETALYHQLLSEAGEWLQAYFNTESGAVKGMLESLQQLKQAELEPSLPDISESLRILRQHRESLGAEVEPVQSEGGEP